MARAADRSWKQFSSKVSAVALSLALKIPVLFCLQRRLVRGVACDWRLLVII